MDRKHGGSSLNHADITGGVGHVEAQKDAAKDLVIAQTKATSNVPQEQQEIRERSLKVDQESLGDSCVIVVSRGNVLPYEAMKNKIMDLFKELGPGVSEIDAELAFNQLDIMYVSSFAAKDKLAYAQWFESGHKLKNLLPLPYWEFENAYIQHKKITHKKDGSRDNVYKKKRWRVAGVDMVRGPVCYYDNLNIECGPDNTRTAKVIFKKVSFKGGDLAKKPTKEDITVGAQFRDANDTKGLEQPMINPEIDASGYVFNYTFSKLLSTNTFVTTNQVSNENVSTNAGLVGMIRWTVARGAQIITKDCPLNLSGDGHSEVVDPKPCPHGPQTSQQCCEEIYGPQDSANNYKWEGGKCVITPKKQVPPPGEQVKQHTVFAPQISCVPNGVTDRKAVTGSISCSLFGSPLVGKYNTSGQSCKDLFGFTMDSKQATAFVNRVKEAYNAKHPDLPIEFAKEYPLDSEFIDALNIASTVGINDVPMAAVCELGRDFVRMSKDKHAGNRSIIADATGTKNEQLIFRNELGAFLAYIHDTSILYPDAFVRVNGKDYCDWRFQPYGVEDGGCARNGGPKMGKGYAHNNYNGTKFEGKYSKYFVPSLTAIMKQAPLKALVGSKDLPHNCGNCKAMNGNNYVKQYNSYKGFAGLLHEETPSINGQGIACEAFLGGNKNATMSVADALKYIEGLCTAGLDYKPVGQGKKEYVQGQSPTSSGGQSGGDEITGQRI